MAARTSQIARRARATARGNGGALRLTHPERVLLRNPVITKADLADFYHGIADFILPGLINRPLMLLRCPEGDGGECFFQKHASRGFPSSVRQLEDRASRQSWLYIAGLEGLMGLVQMSALEYHVWQTTIADLERCDRVVIDLDPGAGVPWKDVVAAAMALRARLAALNLECFVRTSGGKGLHVVVPVRPAARWDLARAFARSLAQDLARARPEQYLAVAAKAQRRGRIYLDYLRNGRGATAVCCYSLRNRPGAPIATPLTWDELPRVRAADQFRFDNIRRRLARLDVDPWDGIDRVAQRLPRLDS